MKVSFFLLALLCSFTSINAQESVAPFYSKNFPISEGYEELSLNIHHANLELKVGDYKDISVIAYVDINGHSKDDIFSIEVSKNNNQLYVQTMMDSEQVNGYQMVQNVSRGSSPQYSDYTTDKSNSVLIMDVYIEIRVPKSIQLKIESQYGNLKLEGIDSDIDLTATYGSVISRLDKDFSGSNLDFDVQYGTFDLAIPEDLKADIRMNTGYGKIYTFLDDHADDRFSKNSNSCTYGSSYKTKTNGGGKAKIDVQVGYKNIYLRAL